MRVSPVQEGRRNLWAISLALTIAVVLIVVNVSIAFVDSIHEFFVSISRVPFSLVLINLLFIWLAFILWLALRRWRDTHRREVDLESIISRISPDTLLVVSPERRVTMCNASVERIFGHTPDEIMGQATDFLYGDRRRDPNRPREIYEALAKHGFHYGIATGKHKDGSSVPLEIISGDLAGSSGAVLLVRDITERRAMEEERRRLEERALRSQKLESLGVLAGGIAHDFNNLLMVIQGNTDLAERREITDEVVRDSMAEVRKSTARGRELCESLLSFAGRAPRDPRSVNISEVTRKAGKLLDIRIPDHVQVEYNLAADGAVLRGDPSLIHQVVTNLMSNACDAIGRHSGTIVVSTGVRDCDATYFADAATQGDASSGRYVFLMVVDTGCGMDEATLRMFCEPFFTTKEKGHGMGMAAVIGIVRSHKGVIKVESEPGSGSTVTALFPAE